MQCIAIALSLFICITARAASSSIVPRIPSEDAVAFIRATNQQQKSNDGDAQTMQPADDIYAQPDEISSQSLFTANTSTIFDLAMIKGRSKIIERRPDISQTDIGCIYQEFSQYGIDALARAYPDLVTDANFLEEVIVKHAEKVKKKYCSALELVTRNAPLGFRVVAWMKVQDTFRKAHKTYLQQKIPNLLVKNSAYKTMAANPHLQLLPEQAAIFRVGLFALAFHMSRHDEDDFEAFHALSRKFEMPNVGPDPAPAPEPSVETPDASAASAPAPEPSVFDSIVQWANSLSLFK